MPASCFYKGAVKRAYAEMAAASIPALCWRGHIGPRQGEGGSPKFGSRSLPVCEGAQSEALPSPSAMPLHAGAHPAVGQALARRLFHILISPANCGIGGVSVSFWQHQIFLFSGTLPERGVHLEVLDLCVLGGVSMKSLVVKRSIALAGRETSVSLEDAFWKRLKEIAGHQGTTLSDLVAAIDSRRQHRNLSSALRIFVLDFYCSQNDEVASLSPAERMRNERTPLGDSRGI
jgi:predicted DNA-binding ribbon-helix-helix protein